MIKKKYFETKLNNKEITKALQDVAAEIGDIKPALRVAGRTIMNIIDDNFETEGTATGDKFEEWSEEWYNVRERLGKADSKIMTFDGDLRRSIERKITGNTLIVGTAKEYAAAHNFGYAPRNLPQREFMRLDDWAKEQIAGKIAYDLAKRIANRVKRSKK